MTDKLPIILTQLHSKARNSANSYSSSLLEYADFRRRFLPEFDDEEVIIELMTVLYGRIQSPNESVQEFLGQQWALTKRLMPGASEQSLLRIFKYNLRGEIKGVLAEHSFPTAEALSSSSSQLGKIIGVALGKTKIIIGPDQNLLRLKEKVKIPKIMLKRRQNLSQEKMLMRLKQTKTEILMTK